MIQISKDVSEKLTKFSGLSALADRLSNAGDEEGFCELIDDEYRAMQSELVEEFLPLVKRLVNAGLIMLTISNDDKTDPFKGLVGGDAVSAWANGIIQINATEIDVSSPCSLATVNAE